MAKVNYDMVKNETDYSKDVVEKAKELLGFWKEERERQGVPYTTWEDAASDVKALFLFMASKLIASEEKKPVVHFYYGDEIKIVDVMDGDEKCEGNLELNEVVKVLSRSTETGKMVVIRRANGKQVQLEKERFVLHKRAPMGATRNVTFVCGVAQE